MQHSQRLTHNDTPGALGLGQATATRIYCAFYVGYYFAPIAFAMLSDSKLGRFRTLFLSLVSVASPQDKYQIELTADSGQFVQYRVHYHDSKLSAIKPGQRMGADRTYTGHDLHSPWGRWIPVSYGRISWYMKAHTNTSILTNAP